MNESTWHNSQLRVKHCIAKKLHLTNKHLTLGTPRKALISELTGRWGEDRHCTAHIRTQSPFALLLNGQPKEIERSERIDITCGANAKIEPYAHTPSASAQIASVNCAWTQTCSPTKLVCTRFSSSCTYATRLTIFTRMPQTNCHGNSQSSSCNFTWTWNLTWNLRGTRIDSTRLSKDVMPHV